MVQGYYFCQPEIIEGKKLSGTQQSYLRLLTEVNRPEIDLDKLEEIVKSDVSLASKLLLYLNSASLGVSQQDNVHQASDGFAGGKTACPMGVAGDHDASRLRQARRNYGDFVKTSEVL